MQLRCKIGWHKWQYFFQPAPWTEYRGCSLCERIEESYHPAGFAPLAIRWKQITVDDLMDAWIQFQLRCT